MGCAENLYFKTKVRGLDQAPDFGVFGIPVFLVRRFLLFQVQRFLIQSFHDDLDKHDFDSSQKEFCWVL